MISASDLCLILNNTFSTYWRMTFIPITESSSLISVGATDNFRRSYNLTITVTENAANISFRDNTIKLKPDMEVVKQVLGLYVLQQFRPNKNLYGLYVHGKAISNSEELIVIANEIGRYAFVTKETAKVLYKCLGRIDGLALRGRGIEFTGQVNVMRAFNGKSYNWI